jgi:acetylornithine/succinyldiaminopimelate/putrescine aminotransferase
MSFNLPALLASRSEDGPALWDRHLNPQMSPALRIPGMAETWDRAQGAWLFGAGGRLYLDMLSGFGVFAAGRNHPVIAQAVKDVTDIGLADMMQTDTPLLAGLLAERLLATAPGLDRAWFCNSGSEAVEAALKFARCATGRSRVLYCDHAFHGLTAGPLGVNGCEEFRKGFGPLLPGTAVPSGDLEAVRRELRRGDVAALIIEPVQGKTLRVVPDGYLAAAGKLLHRHGALLICDEVQSGLGRTGKWWAYQYDPGCEPDLITTAKALSGGFVPAAAVLGKDWIWRKVFRRPGDVLRHGSTFGGNNAAMAAGLATLAVIEDEDLISNAARQGTVLRQAVEAMAGEYGMPGGLAGRGLMLGVRLAPPRPPVRRAVWKGLSAAGAEIPAAMIVKQLHDRGVVTQVAGAGQPVVKLLPPLVIGPAETTFFLDALRGALVSLHSGARPMLGFACDLTVNALTGASRG